jgi:hypothetical protein
MEEKINIAEILKDKPQGTKLYDLLRNIDVELDKVHITDVGSYIVCTATNEAGSTRSFGYSKLGTEECWLDGLQILFPSKSMQDWSKFVWKKGDVLICKDNTHIIFEKFEDNTYTRFKGKYYLSKLYAKEDFYESCKEIPKMFTSSFEKANDYDAQTYIKTVEERLGGKLNLESLEIEKQPEFKDGDILYAEKDESHTDTIFILRIVEGERKDYACLILNRCPTCDYSGFGFIGNETLRYATEEEKRQLFDALAKKGKAWDAEHKMIVDLKPKVELKPFDKVLVKDNPYGSWEPALFWKRVDVKDIHTYKIIGGKRYRYCEPYEGNEHLLDN